MANENERKHDPAENRREEMGHRWDAAKTGGDEKNVGQTGGAVSGNSVGTNAPIGGSASFLSGEDQQDRDERTSPESAEGQFAEQGSAAMGRAMDGGPQGTGSTGAVLPGGADSEFARTSGGQTMGMTEPSGQGGSSASGQAEPNQVLTGDQGGSGTLAGQPQSGTSAMAANNSRADLGAAGVGPNGQQSSGIESGGTPGAFVGREQPDSGDYVQQGRDQPNQGGFADQGRGAPEGSGPEGSSERKANSDTDIEGSSRR
jgi:hypothetical protein